MTGENRIQPVQKFFRGLLRQWQGTAVNARKFCGRTHGLESAEPAGFFVKIGKRQSYIGFFDGLIPKIVGKITQMADLKSDSPVGGFFGNQLFLCGLIQ